MGLVKEPHGIDLSIGPSTLTEKDKKRISEVIAEYKRSGKKPRKKTGLSSNGRVKRQIKPIGK